MWGYGPNPKERGLCLTWASRIGRPLAGFAFGVLAFNGFQSKRRARHSTMSIWNHANPQLKDLVAYEPGKPIEDVARERGLKPEDIIKLASNENPLGPSPKAIQAMQEAVKEVHIYPDGASWKLRNALASKFGLEMGNIIVGSGSNEIIEFIGHAFLKPGDNIITAEHAFLVYKLMAKVFGADTIEVPDPGFAHGAREGGLEAR